MKLRPIRISIQLFQNIYRIRKTGDKHKEANGNEMGRIKEGTCKNRKGFLEENGNKMRVECEVNGMERWKESRIGGN